MATVVAGRRAPALAGRMRAAASAFLASLDEPGRAAAQTRLDADDAQEWTYLPGPRPGLALVDMSPASADLALTLLDTALSERGRRTARDVMKLESILRELERANGTPDWERRHPQHFWVRVLGDPADGQAWSWRVNGHHLAVHISLVGDDLSGTPQFFGANPAVVPSGPAAGVQTLPAEERLGRGLLTALDDGQRSIAVVDPVAPYDLATRHDPVADIGLVQRGIRYADLSADQRPLFEDLVHLYLDRMTPEVAEPAWAVVVEAGLDDATFAWAGGPLAGDPHYYSVTGGTFLLEYDCVQDGANHVHTVWRDVQRDWGTDLLAAHHATGHHAG